MGEQLVSLKRIKIKAMEDIKDKFNIGRLILLFLFTLLIIYGSLYPFSGWQRPDSNIWNFLVLRWPRHISRTDLITNFLVYVPLGFFITRSLNIRLSPLPRIFIATILGTVLSFLLECLQVFLPGRNSSLFDVLLNAAGTFAGATFAEILGDRTAMGKKLISLRQELFLPGRLIDLGLVVLVFWALSQLIPLVPSLDLGNLKYGLRPLWHILHNINSFSPYQAVVYTFNIAGLGIIASLVVKNKNRATAIFASFVTIVLLFKVPIVGRQLSMEAVSGLFCGLFLLVSLRRLPDPVLVIVAAVAILAAFIIDELHSAKMLLCIQCIHPFNWIPFRRQMTNLMGIVSIMEGLWPFAALSFLTMLMRPQCIFFGAILAGLPLFILVFVLEWIQLGIPGRYPDITAVLLAVIGWTVPILLIDVRNARDVQMFEQAKRTTILNR